MGQEEFAKILQGMMNDTDMVDQVAEGDFGDLAEDDLTAAERALLTAAAGDLDDDVSGFGHNIIPKLDDISRYTEVEWTFKDQPDLSRAFGYLKLGDIGK